MCEYIREGSQIALREGSEYLTLHGVPQGSTLGRLLFNTQDSDMLGFICLHLFIDLNVDLCLKLNYKTEKDSFKCTFITLTAFLE